MKVLQSSFTGGELDPSVHGRPTLDLYTRGLATCLNYIVQVQGGVRNRPGLRYVNATKQQNGPARLVPFAYNDDDVYLLEIGAGYMRVYRNGALVLLPSAPSAWVTATAYAVTDHVANDGVNYYCHTAHTSGATTEPGTGVDWENYWHALEGDIVEIPVPFNQAALDTFDFEQTGDIIAVTHGSYPPAEIRRDDHHLWRYEPLTFAPSMAAPTSLAAQWNGTVGGSQNLQHTVAVAAVDSGGDLTPAANFTFSAPSRLAWKVGERIDVTWDAVPSAVSYLVFWAQTSYDLADFPETFYLQASVASNSWSGAPVYGGTPANSFAFGGFVDTVDNLNVEFVTSQAGVQRDYAVTAIDADTGEESLPAFISVITDKDSEWKEDEYVDLDWDDDVTASKWHVYKALNGLYGFIGSAATNTFRDDKIAPEIDDGPPVARNPFPSAPYPTCVTHHEQRRVYGGAEPQRVDMSVVGFPKNFGIREPAADNDALELTIQSTKVAQIRHVLSAQDLLVFAGSEFRITSGDNPFVLDNLKRRQQSDFGVEAGLRPMQAGDSVLFVPRGGQAVRDFKYSFNEDKFSGGDLSVQSKHLLTERRIVSWAYQSEPNPVVWMVCDDGVLLGLTLAPEHEVVGWHRHTTDGVFERVVVLPDSQFDVVYALVKRTIGGQDAYYIERLERWEIGAIEASKFLDSHLTGTITGNTITGLSHLEGKTVTAFVGGDVIPDLVVASGAVTLPRTYTSAAACVGLPYTARLRTLEPPVQEGYGNELSIARLQIRLLHTRGVFAGPSETDLTEMPTRDLEDWGEPNQPRTGLVEIVIEPSWTERGHLVIEQPDPLPSYILALVPEVEVGG